jgi:adenylate cyclase
VRDHVHGRLGLAFEALGTVDLKNIARPVEAFVLQVDPGSALLNFGKLDAPPLPGKPSIAVLAFTNMSGDLEQEYFSDGIADDLITELSRSRSLFVIARNSSFTYKGRHVDVKQLARELGVRYVVEGSVRRSGSRIRVVGQLIEADTGNHIWAERYDRDINEVFAVQDEISVAITNAVLPAVSDVERQRSLRKPPENLGAWEMYQRGLWHMSKCTPRDTELAQQFYDRAIALDPSFACAHTAFAQSIMLQSVSYGKLPSNDAAKLATDRVRMALEIDPNDADAHAILGFALWTAGEFGEASVQAKLALAKNPNSPWANGIHAALLVFGGHPKEGRDAVLTTLRLSPHDPRDANLRGHIVLSHYFEGDYLAAAEAAKRAIAHHPEHPVGYRYLAASLGQLGRVEEARIALQQAIEATPQSFEQIVRNARSMFRSGARTTSTCSTVCARPAGRADAGRSTRPSECGLKVVGRAHLAGVSTALSIPTRMTVTEFLAWEPPDR